MSNSTSTSELIDRLVKLSGIRKKLATELLHAIPEIIEEGLKSDGEVRVKGLGTFRMKWTQARPGRNPKTGESVEIPPRYRLVFLPEQSLKEFINRDNRLLGYKVIPEDRSQKTEVRRQKTEVRSQKSEDRSQKTEDWPETLVRKHRIHWIIPAAISVIIVLSLIFFVRNFNLVEKKTEVRSQKSEDRSQEAEDRIQKSEDGQQSAVGSQQSADTSQNAKLITQNSNSKLKTPDSKLITQNSKLTTISQGQHLFKLAREIYGNPFLWVLIYKANQDLIPDPDEAISGKEIKIPVLEGTPDQLSRNDSLEISEGYRLVYEYYEAKGDERADDFRKGADRYK